MVITNEDNMQLMARYEDNHFDLAIVDPPYGIGLGFSKSKKVKNGTITKGHKQKKWNNFPPNKKYFEELLRVSRKHIIWGCNYYSTNLELFGLGRIIHNKMVTPFLKSTYSHADVAATNCQNRITMFDFQWSGNVQGGKMNIKMENDYGIGIEKRIHPTQKPVKLYEWLLMNYAKEGDKILDTHLGSGSIAIACYNLGYDLTACELDKDYYDASIKRIEQHQQQLTIW